MAGVEIVAHRGANNLAPENTLSSARVCRELGVDWLEVDVRTSRDGKLYVLHDATLKRTTGGAVRKPISRLASDEIDALDVGSWYSATYAGERVPRIEALLEELSDSIKFYFDVKAADLAALVSLVRRYHIEERSFFWFRNPFTAREFAHLFPRLVLKINAATRLGVARARRSYGAGIVECTLGALRDSLVAACHADGMKLMVRCGRNDQAGFKRIIESGADMVNLDHVAEFKDVYDEVRRDQ